MECTEIKRFVELSGFDRMSEREQSILRPRWWMRRRQRGRNVHMK